MLRTQRLRRDIGNGGNGNCEISYMQGRKFPNAGETVEPVQGVSNRNLLKNPYNTLDEPIAKAGQRPLMITTDNFGNVFAKSKVDMVKGVTNDNLLKNPNNIKNVAVGEKRTLSLQRIKDINNRLLPSYITENKGINEVMLQVLTMVENKQVKLITIQLLKILITKNVPIRSAHTEQRLLKALNYLDIVLTAGRRIFKENALSPNNIPSALRMATSTYASDIIKLYNIDVNTNPPNIDTEIQTGLSELGLLSNALSRMFEYNNSIDPSNTLSRDQINAAAFSGLGQQEQQVPAQPPSQGGPQAGTLSTLSPSPQLLEPEPTIQTQTLPVGGPVPLLSNTFSDMIGEVYNEVKSSADYLDSLISAIPPFNLKVYSDTLENSVSGYQEYFTKILSEQLQDPNLDIEGLNEIRNGYFAVINSKHYADLRQKIFDLRGAQGPPPLIQPSAPPQQQPIGPQQFPPPFNPEAEQQAPIGQRVISKGDVLPPLFKPQVLSIFVNSRAVKDFLEKGEYPRSYPTMGKIFLRLTQLERMLRMDKNRDISADLNDITNSLQGQQDAFNDELDKYEQNHGNKFNSIIKALGEIRTFFFPKMKGQGKKKQSKIFRKY
jgi:hypothetical protein